MAGMAGPRDTFQRLVIYVVNRLAMGFSVADIADLLSRTWNFLTTESIGEIISTAQSWQSTGEIIGQNLTLEQSGEFDASALLPESVSEVVVTVTVYRGDGTSIFKTLRVPILPGSTYANLLAMVDSGANQYMEKYGEDNQFYEIGVQYAR
jgi:hypothetical protein